MTELEQLVSVSQRLRPRTKAIYISAVKSFIKFAGPSSHNWTPEAVMHWQQIRSKQTKNQSVNLQLAGIKYAAKRLALIKRDPNLNFAAPIEMLRVESKIRKRAISVEDGQALLATCDSASGIDIRDRAILMLGFRTGMRRAAIIGIQFKKIAHNRIGIILKGNHEHDVYLDSESHAALITWMQWLEASGASMKPDTYVFRALSENKVEGVITIRGKLSESAIYRMVSERGKSIGLKLSPHVMRHSFVSWSIDAGVPHHRIREVTGHKTDAMIRHYTTDLQAEADPVGAHLPSLLK